jgi:apolipoprotein N-acyltransferase
MNLKSVLSVFFILPVLSGLMLWQAWPPLQLTFLVFAGFVPLLVAEKVISDTYKKYTGLKVWISLYTGLLVWNLITTYWISIASLAGGLFANLANPALMSVPFMLARNTRKQFGNRLGYASLVFYWMAFESIHLSWELTWPWLSVGNVFAVKHTWIQWYEYTGVFGGTLWVWITNLLLFFILYDRLFPSEKINPVNNSLFKKYIPLFSLVLIIFIPILISKIIYNNYEEKGKPVNVTVLQPNFDPYKEKFDIPYAIQMEKMQGLSKQKLTDSTDYLVWPETSIQKDIWLDKIKYEKPVRDLSKLIDSFPNLTIVLGINGFERYTSQDASITARMEIIPRLPSKTSDTLFYDIYNTALQIDSSLQLPYYHKSKLVPGVERMPYPQFIKFLGDKAIALGGIEGSLGTQKERTVFYNKDSVGIAPVICFESVFGEYVSDYVSNGAELIFIITNDGWWGNTSGYQQHCLYGKLRSIETRRSIARSANTGISCFINQHGDISQPTEWREDAVLNATLLANDDKTFYVEFGDYLARVALWISGFLILMTLVSAKIINRKNNKELDN